MAYNLETAHGLVAAAERTGTHVLLQTGASPLRPSGWTLAKLALSLAESTEASIGVHLDHSSSLEEVVKCLRLGYSSAALDASHLPFDENVAITREAVHRAHDRDAWVEAEPGGLGGAMTDPQQAADFVGLTGVDVLAVTVGNGHGCTPTPAVVDLDRLAALRRAARVPLALHGASGLAARTLFGCLNRGVVNVNVTALAAGREAVARAAMKLVALVSRSSDTSAAGVGSSR